MGSVEAGFADFLPDGRLVFAGHAPGKPGVSPDGRQIAVLDKDGVIWIDQRWIGSLYIIEGLR